MVNKNKKIELLKQYCERNRDIVLGFLYGSRARGMETDESDFDIAVLLINPALENTVWRDISRITEKEVDLVNIARAPATLVSNVFKTGIPLTIKNRKQYLRLYLEKTNEAEDFAEFAKSYHAIANRSHSLTPEDRTRLIERVQFLEQELSETERFFALSEQTYQENRTKRREIERWAENIINALIDCAKIILAAEKRVMPKTYESALNDFAIFFGLTDEAALRISACARLRNILAHEYLDILYEKIQEFIRELPEIQSDVLPFLKKFAG